MRQIGPMEKVNYFAELDSNIYYEKSNEVDDGLVMKSCVRTWHVFLKVFNH